MTVIELNMDGLVGPSHHYAGLSHGNIASTTNALRIANPQAAALQGINKMRLLHQHGIRQAILPPHQRPNLALLHQLGFTGSSKMQIEKAHQQAPELLSACYSASSMWAANAATVSASEDCPDRKVHFTAANLVGNLHRHQEAAFSKYLLERLFRDDHCFQHHPILPASLGTGDEGAANHSRLCASHSEAGINLFVYGKRTLNNTDQQHGPMTFPARQTLEASQAIARAHGLDDNRVVFACQNPEAIDSGVFHNDVIAVANESVLLVHQQAWRDQSLVYQELQAKADFEIHLIEIAREQLSMAEAVSSYLFNSQLLTLPDGAMVLVSPTECETMPRVRACIDELIHDSSNPIAQVWYLDLRQSMQNGGGPACLRLRVPLHDRELQAMHQGILVNESLLDKLEAWVRRHYRNQLTASDLSDPGLPDEIFAALDELTSLLLLGSIYPFQL